MAFGESHQGKGLVLNYVQNSRIEQYGAANNRGYGESVCLIARGGGPSPTHHPATSSFFFPSRFLFTALLPSSSVQIHQNNQGSMNGGVQGTARYIPVFPSFPSFEASEWPALGLYSACVISSVSIVTGAEKMNLLLSGIFLPSVKCVFCTA